MFFLTIIIIILELGSWEDGRSSSVTSSQQHELHKLYTER